MPKVVLTESQKERERLLRNIDLIQGKRTNNEMGKIIGASGQTFRNRKKCPESFTLAEVRLMCRHFKIDRADFITNELEIIGAGHRNG